MRVSELHPGMQMRDPSGQVHTFIAQCVHPYYLGFQLVIWRLANGELSLDALLAQQTLIGEVLPGDLQSWRHSVRGAIGIE